MRKTRTVLLYATLAFLANDQCLANRIDDRFDWDSYDTSDPYLKNRCEIEISTRGSCLVNSNRVKPSIIVHLKAKPIKMNRQPSPSFSEASVDTDVKESQPNLPSENQKENLPSELEKLRLDMLDDKIKLSVIREFVSQFIELMKQEYGEYWNPLRVNEIQFLQLKNWGKASLYDLKVYGLLDMGLADVEPTLNTTIDSAVWKFNVRFQVSNLTSEFNVDANIENKIFIKHWKIQLLMTNCILKSNFVVDFQKQILLINTMHVESFENFQLVSETLTWPFNQIVSSIVKQEKFYLRHIIELSTQKFINMTLNRDFDLNKILNKIVSIQTSQFN